MNYGLQVLRGLGIWLAGCMFMAFVRAMIYSPSDRVAGLLMLTWTAVMSYFTFRSKRRTGFQSPIAIDKKSDLTDEASSAAPVEKGVFDDDMFDGV